MRTKRSIPSLDGLRALSVAAVILGHTRSPFLDRIPFSSSFRNGEQGVAVVFVISGFLITHLLLLELRERGTISLKRFYFRRTLRIFPSFYVFLLVVCVLSTAKALSVDPGAITAAATYTWNYVPVKNTWILGHCWSLALEEQFYLLWPACLAFLGPRKSIRVAIAIIALSPFSRIATYWAWPAMRSHLGMMAHTRFDALMAGCLVALVLHLGIWNRVRSMALRPFVPIAAIAFLLGVDTPATLKWRGLYQLTIGYSLENLAIVVLLLFVVVRNDSFLAALLNTRVLRHLGRISYSLYLWQQLFTGPRTLLFPLNIALIVLCAELSFFLIERPSLQLRDKLNWSHESPQISVQLDQAPREAFTFYGPSTSSDSNESPRVTTGAVPCT